MPDHTMPLPAGQLADAAGGPGDELRILLLEDHAPDAERIERELTRNNIPFKLRRVITQEAFGKELHDFHPTLILADCSLPGVAGLETIRLARQAAPEVPCIIVTAEHGDEMAAQCIKAGADDYLLKEKLSRLAPAIAEAFSRRHAAEESDARKRRYRELLEILPEGVVELDGEGRIVYANRAFSALLGYTPEELSGRRGLDILGNGAAREPGLLDRPGASGRLELQVHRKSGELLWIEFSGAPIPDRHGALRGSVGIVRDITARKEAERALTERGGKFSAAFHGSVVAMSLSGLERGEYIDVNDRFLELVGRRREEVIGHTAVELGLWPSSEDRSAVVERLERDGTLPAFESTVMHPSHGQRIWSTTLQLISFAGGRHLFSIIEDVTDQKRAEERLREAENRFAMFSDAAFEGIVVVEGETVVDANEQFAAMLGYTTAELIGTKAIDVVAPEWKERTAEMIRTGSNLVYEPVLVRRDGSRVPVEARGRRFLHRGVPVRVTAIRDISLRRQHEALLNGQRHVLELIANESPLGETLEELLRLIEAQAPEMLCSILRLDPDGRHLRHAAAPNLPESYIRAIDGAEIGPASGSCGTAAFRGEQVVVTEIATDPLWSDYRDLALGHGLQACWSTPIFDPDRRVLGTFAIYFRTPRPPAPEHERLVKMATHTAAIAMLRHERGEALRHSEEKFSRAFQQSPDSITISRMEDGKFIETNEGFERISGYRREEAIGRTAVELGIWRNAEQRDRLVQGLRSRGYVRQMDFDLTIKGGEVRACQMSAERLTIGGEDCLVATTRDVTEQRRADQELLRKSAEIIEILERVTDGFVALDKEWRYTYVNAQAASMFSREQASLIGKHIWTEFPEGLGQPFHLAYEQAMRDQRAVSLEDYFPAWDRWFENRIYPSPDGLSIYFRDITERKRSEELLRESELRYQTLLQSVEGIVWEADARTLAFTFVSHQAERLLGYPVEQWTGEPSFWHDHLHPDDRDQAVAYRMGQEEGTGPRELEYRMIDADGQSVWLRDLASVVVEGRRPKYLRGLMVDISEQKKVNEALKSSEARFRAVAETATAAIFVYRGDEFSYVNAGAASITGFSVEELGGMTFSQLIHPDFRELVRGRGDLNMLGEGTPARYELKLVTRSGAERWVDFSTRLMEFDGKEAALGIAFDVTDRRKAEELLQRTTEQLRKLSAHLQSIREEEQTRISREIHDQLGQAMTGLRMDVSWISRRLGEHQDDLKARTDGMKSLIDETIHTMRRISSELRPAVLDNLGLVPAIDWHAKEFQARTGIVCELRLPDESPALDAEASTAVFRIFQETLTNVARHSGADRVTVSLTSAGGMVEFEVVDNGKGILPGDIGKSLGLVGMRERAMNVGGSVSVTGEPGVGTRMLLRVPLQRREVTL